MVVDDQAVRNGFVNAGNDKLPNFRIVPEIVQTDVDTMSVGVPQGDKGAGRYVKSRPYVRQPIGPHERLVACEPAVARAHGLLEIPDVEKQATEDAAANRPRPLASATETIQRNADGPTDNSGPTHNAV
jgi:hypothetical protein